MFCMKGVITVETNDHNAEILSLSSLSSLSLSLSYLLDTVGDIHMFIAAAFTNVNIPQGIE